MHPTIYVVRLRGKLIAATPSAAEAAILIKDRAQNMIDPGVLSQSDYDITPCQWTGGKV